MTATQKKNKNRSSRGPQNPNDTAPSNSTVWILAGVVAIVVLAFGAALLLGGEDEPTVAVDASGEPIPEAGSPTVDGDPLPEAIGVAISTDAAADPAIGMIAPSVAGSDFNGDPVDISADGTPKAVMFLAHWCPHCQNEVPKVVELQEDGEQPDNIEVYGVSTGLRPGGQNYPPSAWFQKEDWTSPLIRDDTDSSVFTSFGGTGFPYVVYLDGDNKVIARSSGPLEKEDIKALWLATSES